MTSHMTLIDNISHDILYNRQMRLGPLDVFLLDISPKREAIGWCVLQSITLNRSTNLTRNLQTCLQRAMAHLVLRRWCLHSQMATPRWYWCHHSSASQRNTKDVLKVCCNRYNWETSCLKDQTNQVSSQECIHVRNWSNYKTRKR